jgi:hypothetical protein
MKKNRGNEPTGVLIHIYMETSQGNSLCSYPYLKQAKTSFFFFILLQNQRSGGRNRSCPGGVGTSGMGEVTEKGDKRVNTVQKMYTHVCKYKNDTC